MQYFAHTPPVARPFLDAIRLLINYFLSTPTREFAISQLHFLADKRLLRAPHRQLLGI